MSGRPLRVLLVDDERLARADMRRLLAAHARVEVVGEAASAAEAREAIASLGPDLVFLDVQMPGESGFDLLASLDRVPPAVVFTTAFDRYAIDAFRVNALDYLLKPVDPERLAEALGRVDPAPATGGVLGPDLLGPEDRVFVRDGERLSYVRVGDVRLVESEGNYARLVTATERPLVYRSLNHLEARLDPALFFRASRRHLVNLRAVVRIEDGLAGRLLAVLDGGETVELSRRQAQRFRDRLSL